MYNGEIVIVGKERRKRKTGEGPLKGERIREGVGMDEWREGGKY